MSRITATMISAAPVMMALATETPSDPLPFRSQMFLTDRVKTGDHNFARLLLGGRVMVLAREGSTLNITEVPGATTIDAAMILAEADFVNVL